MTGVGEHAIVIGRVHEMDGRTQRFDQSTEGLDVGAACLGCGCQDPAAPVEQVRTRSLEPSSGGAFEVHVDGKELYSKLATGKFPDEARLVAEISGRA